jgi:hypothetical protein
MRARELTSEERAYLLAAGWERVSRRSAWWTLSTERALEKRTYPGPRTGAQALREQRRTEKRT